MKKMIGKLALLTALIMLLQSCGSVQTPAKDTDAQTAVVSTTASAPAELPAATEAPAEEVDAEETPAEDLQPEEASAEEVPAEANMTEKPAAEETPAEAATTEEHVSEETPAEAIVTEEPVAEEEQPEEVQPEEASAEEAPAEAIVTEEPAAEETPAEAAAAEEPVAEEKLPEEASAEEVPAEANMTEEPAAEETPAEAAATEEPVAEEEQSEEVQPEEASAEEAPAEAIVTEEPAAEETPAEEAATEEPVAEEKLPEDASAEEAPAEAIVTEESAAEETPAEEAATEEPTSEEEPSEASQPEETFGEEATAEETVTEEPAAEEASAENTITEDPAADETSAENSVTEGDSAAEEAQPEEEAVEEEKQVPASIPFELKVSKQLSGREYREGDSWTFFLSAPEGTPMPEKTEVTVTPTEGDTVVLSFGTVSFTEADLEKTFSYTISEKNEQPGVSSELPMVLLVRLEKNEDDGSLRLITSGGEDGPVFRDVYASDGEVRLAGTMRITGRAYLPEDHWTVKLQADEGTPLPEICELSFEHLSGETVDFDFGTIRFTEADAGKTYRYHFLSDGEGVGVINAEDTVFDLVVTDRADGTLQILSSSPALEIVQRFAADSSLKVGGTLSLSGRDFQPGDEIALTLFGDENAPMPEQTQLILTPDAGNETAFDFGEIIFTEANIGQRFTYTIVESSETPGLVLDADHLFQVRVDMAPDCSLQVRSSLDGRDLHIATGYEASSALNIGGIGLAQGWKPSERYPILVSISADEGTPMPTETAVAPNAYTDEGYTFVFPEIVYNLADAGREYMYTLTEFCAAPGIEASDPVTVRVTIADGGDGTLQLNTDPEQIVMNSAYYAQGFLNVTLNHVFEGRSIAAGDAWTFRLSADKGTPLPEETEFTVPKATDTIILFDPIQFKEVAGADLNYIYTLTATCEMPGVAAPEPVQINVHVYDRGHGRLGIEAKPVMLKSVYRANGELPLRGVKTLTGRDFKPGDSWTLQVKGEESAPMPEWSEITLSPLFGDGIQFDFGSILYSEKDIGKTYVYSLSEVSEIGGVTDMEPIEIKVQVSDQLDGTLKIESSLPESGLMLESAYESAGSLTLNGKKTISGRSFMEGESWQYVISGSFGAPMPDNTTIKLLPTNGQEADILFGTIDYTLKDAGNTYTYTITESTDCMGVTVSEPITFEVKITDQLDGTLKAETSLEEDSLVFASVYSASATIDLAGVMAIANRDYHPGDAWTVTLASQEEAAPQPELWSVTLAPEEGREVPFSFGSVTFTEADAGQRYLYTMGLRGEAAMVTNAPDQTFEIHVLDNGDGTLTLEGAEGAGSLRFENMYHASGEADLAFSVVLKNRDWLPEDISVFTLEAAEGTPLPENLTDITLCPAKDEISSASFGVAHFTEADIGKTYEYVIRQQADAAGVTAEAEKQLILMVTDNGDGTLTVQPPEGETAPVFKNTYNASASMTLPVRVLLQGRDFQRTDFWNIQIDSDDEGAPMPDEEEGIQVKWAADNLLEINLGTLHFDLDDVGKTWHYQVTFNGEMPGITNADPKHFTVSVTDPFTGELALEVDPGMDPVAEFHVIYAASGSIDFQGTLSLTGRTATPQDAWDLVLTPDQESAPVPEISRLTVKPFMDESFKFGPIAFTEADAGETYSYTLSVEGKTVSTTNAAPETLTVHVEDRGDGTLYVQGDEPIQLVNTYEVSGSYRLRGAMSITGREFLPGDSWTFSVTAEDGTPMPERQTLTVEPTEGKACVLDFGQIHFDTEESDQEYVYLISVASCPEGIQVPTARLIHVTPRDNKEGKFYFSRSGDTILFENIYTAVGEFSVNAQISLTGRESTAKDLFTLVLTAEEGAPLPEQTEISAAMTAGHPTLSVPFGSIHFTEADAGKTYTYTMQLLTDLPGVSPCEPQSFTLSAADLHNGLMSISLNETASQTAFACVYSAEGDYVLSGSVRMNGRSFREKEPWQIQVTAAEAGTPLPEVSTITMEAEGGTTDAPFAFTIHFTEADAGKIYTYVISVSGGAEDLMLDSKKEVRVLVEDAGNGSLTFKTDYPTVEESLVLESGLRKDFSFDYDDQQNL